MLRDDLKYQPLDILQFETGGIRVCNQVLVDQADPFHYARFGFLLRTFVSSGLEAKCAAAGRNGLRQRHTTFNTVRVSYNWSISENSFVRENQSAKRWRFPMPIENKLKAMGLELPAAAPPQPGRAGAVKVGNILFVGGHT